VFCNYILDLLEENWETLCDTKTGKKIIWNTIANGLEEAGFAVRGSENAKHSRTSGRIYVKNIGHSFQNTKLGAVHQLQRRNQNSSMKLRKLLVGILHLHN
jgi:hypothetical protein